MMTPPADSGTALAAERLGTEGEAVLGDVGRALADGRALRQWWEQRQAAEGYAERFELARQFNQPDRAVGFFDTVPLADGPVPVMGVVQDMFFDRPKCTPGAAVRDQFREFVLRYFLRVSDFRPPAAAAQGGPYTPPNRGLLSWCPRPGVSRAGFGFSQHYYRLRATGRVGRFPRGAQYAIVDLRELGPAYDWVVLKVRIFDFRLTFQPFGPDAPALSVPLRAENYLVVSPDFVVRREDPAPGVLGEYGFGYTFLRYEEDPGPLAYGPGRFACGFQLITFRVLADGTTQARMAFVVNRPTAILNVAVNPVDWGFRLADAVSFGMASRLFAPARWALARLPLRAEGLDPVTAYVDLANGLTAGWAAQELCVSRGQLEKDFLLQHFMQHYQMMVGALLTWRHVPDWCDEAALPDYVRTGVSS